MGKKEKEISTEDKLEKIIKEKKERNDILKKLIKEIEKSNGANK
jgi:hypothetical protein